MLFLPLLDGSAMALLEALLSLAGYLFGICGALFCRGGWVRQAWSVLLVVAAVGLGASRALRRCGSLHHFYATGAHGALKAEKPLEQAIPPSRGSAREPSTRFDPYASVYGPGRSVVSRPSRSVRYATSNGSWRRGECSTLTEAVVG